MNDPENQIDPQLNDLLRQFKNAPSRNPSEAALRKVEFLTEIHQIIENPSPSLGEMIKNWIQSIFRVPKTNVVFRFGLALIAVSIILLGGISGTAYAAQSAIPGDLLYPVKIWVEDTQLLLSLDDEGDIRLRLEFAQERLDEIILLREGTQPHNIVPAVTNFNKNIQHAANLLQTLADEDNPQIDTFFQLYTHLLDEYQFVMMGEAGNNSAADEPPSDDEIEEEHEEEIESEEEEPIEEVSGEEETEEEEPEEEELEEEHAEEHSEEPEEEHAEEHGEEPEEEHSEEHSEEPEEEHSEEHGEEIEED